MHTTFLAHSRKPHANHAAAAEGKKKKIQHLIETNGKKKKKKKKEFVTKSCVTRINDDLFLYKVRQHVGHTLSVRLIVGEDPQVTLKVLGLKFLLDAVPEEVMFERLTKLAEGMVKSECGCTFVLGESTRERIHARVASEYGMINV
jgi:hypothetical protein